MLVLQNFVFLLSAFFGRVPFFCTAGASFFSIAEYPLILLVLAGGPLSTNFALRFVEDADLPSLT